MASDKELTLRMRIAATTRDARRQLRLLHHDLKGLGPVSINAAALVGRSFRGISGTLSTAGRVGRRALLGLVTATVLFTAASVRAESTQEALRTRLDAVSASAAESAAIFRDVASYESQTPFDLNDLVEAQIVLKGIGITGPRALRQTSEAAAAMGRTVSELSMVVASMETEPLRRLGIQLKTEGDRAEFTFRDKFGNIRNVVANTRDEARQALLDIFSTRFAGAANRLATTISGRFSTLNSAIKKSLASFGRGFADGSGLGDVLETLSLNLDAFRAGGSFEKAGERFGEFVKSAMLDVTAAVMTARDTIDILKVEGPVSASQFVGDVLQASASVFIAAMQEGLAATSSIVIALGKMLGLAFQESMWNVDLPGINAIRQSNTAMGITGLSPMEAKTMGLPGSEGFTAGKAFISREEADAMAKQMSRQQQAEFLTRSNGQAMADAMLRARDDATAAMSRLSQLAAFYFGGIQLPGVGGGTLGDIYAQNRSQAADVLYGKRGLIEVAGTRQVEVARPIFGASGEQVGVQRSMEDQPFSRYVYGRQGQFQAGGEMAGGRMVNFTPRQVIIQNYATEAQQLISRLMKSAQPAMNLAGAF